MFVAQVLFILLAHKSTFLWEAIFMRRCINGEKNVGGKE
jgi:hypothetical protein